ncbi:TlpA family protein disulfide reductase [Caballeronia glebae]|uniref:TlpA family protein disulfide reductase n=1 Tax=Caballeronia glebae TaxID=1777143 RepID=UPI0038BB3B85
MQIGHLAIPLPPLTFLLAAVAALSVAGVLGPKRASSEADVAIVTWRLARQDAHRLSVISVLLAGAIVYGSGQILVSQMNEDNDTSGVRPYLDAHSIRFDHSLLDSHGRVAAQLSVKGYQTTLFYDRQRRLAGSHLGPFSKATLSDALKRLYPKFDADTSSERSAEVP